MAEDNKKYMLSGIEFLMLVLIGPIIFAFILLGTIIVWKATTNPIEVAPHLDIILLAFAIFSNPVGLAVAALVQKLKEGENKDD
jgi:hypothetical protein|tara:strand:+ start:228 stop:479 length:252 start_codon:yes stop_codon:yes gene_type:complete